MDIKMFYIISTFFLALACNPRSNNNYTGSSSCIECHADFYQLWSTSHHGKAMQPITAKFIEEEISFDDEEIFMEDAWYSARVTDTILFIQERSGQSTRNYEVLWALGGKNVFYFLTPLENGQLQTLPIAYNVNTKSWYNNPESAIRHFPNMGATELTDEALSWRDIQYSFNTSCYSCHVSQLSNNYNLATNTYETHWKESGINCETCHGPSGDHVAAARKAARRGKTLTDMKLITTTNFTPEQHNASCAPCHAKMNPITASYLPGDPYFDNFDLITLESNDFYPDGRDLGENYTMTTWHMNECASASKMHCVTCHTSSGRYRFKSNDLTTANKACTSCHTTIGDHYEGHTFHKTSDKSPRCIDCHMPLTTFGHMDRSDHSFRPPMPKATIEFGSPNACNICHTDQSPQWAQKHLENWGKDKGYQEETLKAGRLIQQARDHNWEHIDEICFAIENNSYGEVFTASFLRLLANCMLPVKKSAAIKALGFDSPLIRSAACTALSGIIDRETQNALLKAATDQVLLVRLSAATILSAFPPNSFTPDESIIVEKVNNEYKRSLLTRPDQWSAHFNLGTHFHNLGQPDSALLAYQIASVIYPEAVMPRINSSMIYAAKGDFSEAEKQLETILTIEPMNETANFNYGLLMAEMGKMDKAEIALRKVLLVNSQNARAAYNLSIIVSSNNMDEACLFSKMAMDADRSNPQFAYTHALFLHKNNQQNEALDILRKIIHEHPDDVNSINLLKYIMEMQKEVQ